MPSEQDKAVGELFKKVLTWDIYRLNPQNKNLKTLPVVFKDAKEYISTFEPLLLEECRAQILRSLDGSEESCPPALSQVRYLSETGDFVQVGLSVPDDSLLDKFHENDLFMLSGEHPEKIFGKVEVPGEETDDDTVRKEMEDKNGTTADMLKNPLKYYHLIGSVEQMEQGGFRSKFYTKTKDTDGRIKYMNSQLRYARNWWVFKLCNLSTLQREYTALLTSENFPLMQTIATGDCRNENKDVVNEISEPLEREFKKMYNEFQLNALNLALSGHKVSLIQGPPGTGKTHVIMGIMSVLLHSKTVKVAQEETIKEYEPSPLQNEDKTKAWKNAMPWLSADYDCIRDDLSLIDPSYELSMERKRRAIKLKPNQIEPQKPRHAKRILLCAPSNGAVDEIVMRVMSDGLLNSDGVKYTPSIVRVGPGAHKDVTAVTLDALARNKVGSGSGFNPAAAGFHQATKATVPKDLPSARSVVLLEASIVATTLSFSGSSVISKISGFDYVIIDEAAQAVETSTLIPLQHKCKGLILVGDPKQLPATIISKVAVNYKYDQSLFERLMKSHKSELCLLRTQYRMHPSIRQFPSQHFYEDRLEDAPSVLTGRNQPYHEKPCFGPYVFYDLRDTFEQETAAGSVCNTLEANFVFALFQLLVKTYPDLDMQNRVGIISPYRQQVVAIRNLFAEYPTVNVDTVDGYQGREKEFIIFSCVRAPKEGKNEMPTIGFLSDVRRMNVGLTRPRSSLLVVGNSKALKTNPDWRALVNHSAEKSAYIRVQGQKVDDLLTTKFSEAIAKSVEEHKASLVRRQRKEEKKKEMEEKRKENKEKRNEGGREGEGEKEEKGEKENKEEKGGDKDETEAKEETSAEEKEEEKGKAGRGGRGRGRGKKAAGTKRQKPEGEGKTEAGEEKQTNETTEEQSKDEEEDGKKKYKRLKKKS
eukprot:Phypoly_transcript_00365.p1 GENE.Phypoly_transcript_00365~~Phypoly_transcript_00365.p1  ORF type:complete len:928 (+),score=171.75 Phypoly_transcript_00365:2260-5043(+)